jgi:hypothetical protein
MRFTQLHSLDPVARIEALEAQFPPGSRSGLFKSCVPGEYERLLQRVPADRCQRWSAGHTDEDRAAWKEYSKRTAEYRTQEAEVLNTLRPALATCVAEHPYTVEALTALPRLLGDPIDQKGVRLYWRREAFDKTSKTTSGCFERNVELKELVDTITKMQRWGASPFVALHGVPYGMPRVIPNVMKPRVFALDWDEKHGQHPPFAELERCWPDLIIKSGGGFHAYWGLTPGEQQTLPLTLWRRTNLALARALGADEDAVLPTQIMRLPGSVHLKNPGEPKPVRIWAQRPDKVLRSNMAETLTKTFELELREEDAVPDIRARVAYVSDAIPEEHGALFVLLDTLIEQGLCPERDHKGWMFYCPLHEVDHHVEGDEEDGSTPHFLPRTNSTPSGILRVNADKSLALFCGSTVRCGAGPRDILEALGLDPKLTWLEPGGFFNTEFGKAFKAKKIAEGTWEPSTFEKAAETKKQRARKRAKIKRDDGI